MPRSRPGHRRVRDEEAAVKISELRRALVDEFGAGFAAVLSHDTVLEALGGRTPDEALSAGVSARDVWMAVCDAQGIPDSRRRGAGRPEPRG
jgi:hypothetical protein